MTENTAQSLLDSLTSPKQVMDLSDEQLPLLAAELRKRIIDVVSKNGGHLAPSLGVVELTLALLHTLDVYKRQRNPLPKRKWSATSCCCAPAWSASSPPACTSICLWA